MQPSEEVTRFHHASKQRSLSRSRNALIGLILTRGGKGFESSLSARLEVSLSRSRITNLAIGGMRSLPRSTRYTTHKMANGSNIQKMGVASGNRALQVLRHLYPHLRLPLSLSSSSENSSLSSGGAAEGAHFKELCPLSTPTKGLTCDRQHNVCIKKHAVCL